MVPPSGTELPKACQTPEFDHGLTIRTMRGLQSSARMGRHGRGDPKSVTWALPPAPRSAQGRRHFRAQVLRPPGPQTKRAGRRNGRSSGRELAVHVVVIGRGIVALDRRVVDVGGAEGGDAAADADAEQVGRAGLARRGRAVAAEGEVPIRPWRRRRRRPARPSRLRAWLVVMRSVALACLEPFFAPSSGLR